MRQRTRRCKTEKLTKPMNMKKELIIKNEVAELEHLVILIDEVTEELQLDPEIGMSLNLALEEVVSNVILYAYPEGTNGTVQIVANSDGQVLVFTITDQGKAFDPTQVKEADITLSAEERAIGGLGIFIVNQIMDNVSYRRENGQNILMLTKRL